MPEIESTTPGWKDNLILFRGTLSNLTKLRGAAPPRIPPPPPGVVGATAIAATLLGMGSQGQAMMNTTYTSSWKDEADWVEFEMDGKQFDGVLWMMPMSCGDEVRVVAEKVGENRYFAYAVQRESDSVVAIYPYATAGRKARGRSERKDTLQFFIIVEILVVILISISSFRGNDSFVFWLSQIGMLTSIGAAFMLLVYFYAKWKFRNSIEDELAESIFKTFGWPDPRNFDLWEMSQWPDRDPPSKDLPVSDPYWYFNLCYYRYDSSSQSG